MLEQSMSEQDQKAFKMYGKMPAKNQLTKMQKVGCLLTFLGEGLYHMSPSLPFVITWTATPCLQIGILPLVLHVLFPLVDLDPAVGPKILRLGRLHDVKGRRPHCHTLRYRDPHPARVSTYCRLAFP